VRASSRKNTSRKSHGGRSAIPASPKVSPSKLNNMLRDFDFRTPSGTLEWGRGEGKVLIAYTVVFMVAQLPPDRLRRADFDRCHEALDRYEMLSLSRPTL
jgi:hypothetical protein